MQNTNSEKEKPRFSFFNIAVLALTGQVGCITVVVVLTALFLGLWLDTQFGTKPWITFLSILVSTPISIILMIIVSKATVKKITERAKNSQGTQEDQEIGTNKNP